MLGKGSACRAFNREQEVVSMFPTKTVVFMSAFLMAAPFGLSSSAVSAYPGEGVMEGPETCSRT